MSISSGKRIVFSAVLIAIPILIILMLEFGLRIFNYGNDLSLFVKSENYPGYMEVNRDINLRYFTKFNNTSPVAPFLCFAIIIWAIP